MRSLSIYVLILFWRSAPLSPCSWPSVAIFFVLNPPSYLPFVVHLATISIQHKYFVFLHLLSTSELHLLIPFGVLRLSLFPFSPYLQSVEKILLLILIVVARLSSVSPSPEIYGQINTHTSWWYETISFIPFTWNPQMEIWALIQFDGIRLYPFTVLLLSVVYKQN